MRTTPPDFHSLTGQTMISARMILNEAQLAALGLVVAEAARLESTIDLIILVVLDFRSAHFEPILAGRMLKAKIELLKQIGPPRLRSKKRRSIFARLIAARFHNYFAGWPIHKKAGRT